MKPCTAVQNLKAAAMKLESGYMTASSYFKQFMPLNCSYNDADQVDYTMFSQNSRNGVELKWVSIIKIASL